MAIIQPKPRTAAQNRAAAERARKRRAALLAQPGGLPLEIPGVDPQGHEYDGDLFTLPEARA